MVPSPLQQLAMIHAYRQMMTEMSAVFASPPAGLSAEADEQRRQSSSANGATTDATSVRVLLRTFAGIGPVCRALTKLVHKAASCQLPAAMEMPSPVPYTSAGIL